MDVISVEGLSHTYLSGSLRVAALEGVDFGIPEGQMAAIVGPSGSGKSTLLHILGCLMQVERGTYRLSGEDVTKLPGDELARVRGTRIGFVFQAYNLVPQLTALENVELPLAYLGAPRRQRRERALQALDAVGLGERARHRPFELSGGQQQRVGVARALVTEPSVILADEPTGNLDTASGQAVMELFRDLHRQGRTIVVVTHAPEVAAGCERTIHIRDGRVVKDARREGRPRDVARG